MTMNANAMPPIHHVPVRVGRRASLLTGLLGYAPAQDAVPLQRWVWVGEGTSYRHGARGWERTPSHDYEFLVRQDRFADRWLSLKVQNRTHAGYDGRAGAADQQHGFAIDLGAIEPDGRVPLRLRSTYGDGTGHGDAEFRHAVLEFQAAGVSRFAPYDRFRITQHYRYEDGQLDETVELFRLGRDGAERPFAKIEERARLFRPSRPS
jgi:hypothetical protein